MQVHRVGLTKLINGERKPFNHVGILSRVIFLSVEHINLINFLALFPKLYSWLACQNSCGIEGVFLLMQYLLLKDLSSCVAALVTAPDD